VLVVVFVVVTDSPLSEKFLERVLFLVENSNWVTTLTTEAMTVVIAIASNATLPTMPIGGRSVALKISRCGFRVVGDVTKSRPRWGHQLGLFCFDVEFFRRLI
jgi:hypothetical protein